MTKFLSEYYDDLEETIAHIKSIKLKTYLEDNATDLCTSILVDADCLESTRALNPENLGYITRIFEDNNYF